MEYEPVPAPGQKKVGGGRAALKLLLAVLLAGLALRLLADHCASYRLPPPAAPEEAAAFAVTAPVEETTNNSVPVSPNGERVVLGVFLCSLPFLFSLSALVCSVYYRQIDGKTVDTRAFSGELALLVPVPVKHWGLACTY
jgi:hypothetical protein